MNTTLIVCIIDDDDIHQYSLKRALNLIEIQKEILTFSDGEQAINFITENIENTNLLPDIILLDINMPIMDGFDFIEAYVKLKSKIVKKITIHMLSSSVNPVDIKRANEISEISQYIIKPVQPDLLEQLVRST